MNLKWVVREKLDSDVVDDLTMKVVIKSKRVGWKDFL